MNDKLMEKLAIEHPELKWYIDIVKINEDFEQYQSGGLDKFVKTMQDDEKDLDEFIKTIPENFWELASDRLKNDSYFIQQVEEIVGEEVLQPSYMPKDYELTRITIQVLETKQVVTAKYNNKNGKYFRFKIDIYKEKYREDVVQYNSEWKYLGEDESKYKAQYYCKDEIIESFFSQGKNIYYILSNENIDIIKDVIEQIG